MSKYIVSSSDNSFELTKKEIESMDIQMSSGLPYHLIEGGTNHSIEAIKSQGNPKEITVVLDGKEYSVVIKDEYDQLIDELGMDKVGEKKLSNISAPMPGLILDILVEAGQEFEEGDSLLILEAMKMENIIKAEGAGKVKTVLSNKGETVEKSQIIIELEEQ